MAGTFYYNEGDLAEVGFTPNSDVQGWTYSYWTTSGTATAGVDYEDVNGSFTLGGDFRVKFQIFDDEEVEGDESFIFHQQFTSPDGYVGQDSLTIIIRGETLDAVDDRNGGNVEVALKGSGLALDLYFSAGGYLSLLALLQNDFISGGPSTLDGISVILSASGFAEINPEGDFYSLEYSVISAAAAEWITEEGAKDSFIYEITKQDDKDTAYVDIQWPTEEDVFVFMDKEHDLRQVSANDLKNDSYSFESAETKIKLLNGLLDINYDIAAGKIAIGAIKLVAGTGSGLLDALEKAILDEDPNALDAAGAAASEYNGYLENLKNGDSAQLGNIAKLAKKLGALGIIRDGAESLESIQKVSDQISEQEEFVSFLLDKYDATSRAEFYDVVYDELGTLEDELLRIDQIAVGFGFTPSDFDLL